MDTVQDGTTELYTLRHATPAASDLPNRARPLSELGQQQARTLGPYLASLGLTAVYTSPFQRAVASVEPFCQKAGLTPIVREDLGESGADEELPQVRQRLIGALTSIAQAHPGQRVLACTHGGCLWGTISHFDANFGYQDYRRIGTPDMRRIVFTAGTPRLDPNFIFAMPTDQ
ncbi:MAG: hypothetical protein GKR89_25915 [Candidatus Latescibacteria bacterium]|nr:hypothetical protein [Candidatus Latescibacterota bacterium]